MPRVIESAEDEDQGWGVRKSPYEYDGNVRDTGKPSAASDVTSSKDGRQP
ncbi:hypothetical protein H6F77_11640 [Microcoleus sp. FACHB-831]|nr:hypothetical protein [Microcoleus sp. FACHB-831]MBD1921744.1 hypothetical protein [Microcoleus sp. FACHB-831]